MAAVEVHASQSLPGEWEPRLQEWHVATTKCERSARAHVEESNEGEPGLAMLEAAKVQLPGGEGRIRRCHYILEVVHAVFAPCRPGCN